MTDLPLVGVWQQSGSVFRKVGQVRAYTTLTFTPTWQDYGSWEMTAPYVLGSSLLPGRLVTIDWRDVRTTWTISEFHPSQDENSGTPVVTVSGQGAKGLLAEYLCWPDATNTIDAQPTYLPTKPAPYTGPAETVLRTLAAQNARDRWGAPLQIPASLGLGSTVKVRPQMGDNLFELMQTNAKDGGINFDIGLENVTATTARLWLRFAAPVDKTRTVRLKSQLGTVAGWEMADTAPTATHAVVAYGPDAGDTMTTLTADMSTAATSMTVASSNNFPTPPFLVVIEDETLRVDSMSGKTWSVTRGIFSTAPEAHEFGDGVRPTRRYRVVTTDASLAAAATWGPREVFVSGPDSTDVDEITASGRAALSDGAETRALSLTAAEAEGMQAFIHYTVGDRASAEIPAGTATDVITAIEVDVDPDAGITVKPTFGNPGTVNSSLRTGQIVQSLARQVRRIIKRRG